MKRIAIAALAGSAVLFSGAASAQQQVDFSKVEIKATDLGNKTYMLEGQGGNITVAVGTDGVIMVDTQFAPLHDKIKAAIEKIAEQKDDGAAMQDAIEKIKSLAQRRTAMLRLIEQNIADEP